MDLVTRAIFGLVAVLAGVVIGLGLGYALWAGETVQVADLSGELEQTKAWLLDEINWSDERYEVVSAALTKSQTESASLRAELARTRAMLDQPAASLKSDRLRRPEVSEAARRPSAH
jgi:hypothetical protein